MRRCMFRLERTFQLVFRSSRSVCDESRIALTLSASSACGERERSVGAVSVDKVRRVGGGAWVSTRGDRVKAAAVARARRWAR